MAEVYQDGESRPRVLKGAELVGSDQTHRTYGFFDESRHFIDCIKAGRQPMTNLDDSVKTRMLVDRILEAGRGSR